MIKIEVHSSIALLKEEWTLLDKQASELLGQGRSPIEYSFYQTYAWNEFVEKHYAGKGLAWRAVRRTEYVALRENGELKIILPLLVTTFPSRKIELISWKTSGINNASSLLGLDDNSRGLFRRLVDFMAVRYKDYKIKFNDMPSCAPLVHVMAALSAVDERQRPSYHVPVGRFGSFDEYYASLSKNFHTGYRRCRNHFTHGDLTCGFKVFDRDNQPSVDYWKKLWGMYFLRKIDWKKKSRSFWRKLYAAHEASSEISGGLKTASFAALDNSRLFVFEIDGEPAAFCLVYVWGSTGVMPKFAIDTRYSAHSPGILMFMDVMKWCLDNGIDDFDLCRGDERYKKRVGGVMESLSRIHGKFVNS